MAKIRKEKKKIPYGIYCHGTNGTGEYILCPHWDAKRIPGIDNMVYSCRFLNLRDSEEETLLWDQCKECCVREDIPHRVLNAANHGRKK